MRDNYTDIYKKLSDIYGDSPIIFVKFFEKFEYAKDFLCGKLYCNTPKFYKDLEEETRTKGQGDKSEGVLRLEIVGDVKLINKITGELEYYNPESLKLCSSDLDSTIPIFCFMCIRISDMCIFDITDEDIVLKIKKGEWLDKIINDCGKFFVVFEPDLFLKKYDEFLKEQLKIEQSLTYEKDGCSYNISYKRDRSFHSKVEYYDVESEVDLKQLEDFIGSENPLKRYKYKESFFEYQKEYRIVTDMKIPNDHFINIGKIKGKIFNSNNVHELGIKFPRYFKGKPTFE